MSHMGVVCSEESSRWDGSSHYLEDVLNKKPETILRQHILPTGLTHLLIYWSG